MSKPPEEENTPSRHSVSAPVSVSPQSEALAIMEDSRKDKGTVPPKERAPPHASSSRLLQRHMTFSTKTPPRARAIPVIVRGATRHVPRALAAPDWKGSGAPPPGFYRLAAGTRFPRRNFLVVLRRPQTRRSWRSYRGNDLQRVRGETQAGSSKPGQGALEGPGPRGEGGEVGTLCPAAEEYRGERRTRSRPPPAPTGFPRPRSSGGRGSRAGPRGGSRRPGAQGATLRRRGLWVPEGRARPRSARQGDAGRSA